MGLHNFAAVPNDLLATGNRTFRGRVRATAMADNWRRLVLAPVREMQQESLWVIRIAYRFDHQFRQDRAENLDA
jgi:hypothetical protein